MSINRWILVALVLGLFFVLWRARRPRNAPRHSDRPDIDASIGSLSLFTTTDGDTSSDAWSGGGGESGGGGAAASWSSDDASPGDGGGDSGGGDSGGGDGGSGGD
ncbi:MAG: hypothetical protein EPO46_05320 [Lysobacter sp.]|nr:MAG: hypothetical protein EPO46_05320 [Lysobacter sp.]